MTTALDGDSDKATLLDRQQRGLELRRKRTPWQEIADTLGYASRGAAYNAVMGYLRDAAVETASELRQLENDGMDADEQVLHKIITGDDATVQERIRAVDARTRLRARRARMNGLDAPVQVAISAVVKSDVDNALAELGELFTETVVPGDVTKVAEGWEQ